MDKSNKLLWAIGFSTCFMLLELSGGILADSLAILSDAVHMFSDISGFVIAYIAVVLASKPPSKEYSYGQGRAEVLGAFISLLSLWIATIYLMVSALYRILLCAIGSSHPVNGKIMFIVACIGVFANICLASIFHQDHSASGTLSIHGHSCTDESCVIRNSSTDNRMIMSVLTDKGDDELYCGDCVVPKAKTPPPRTKLSPSRKLKSKYFNGTAYNEVSMPEGDDDLLGNDDQNIEVLLSPIQNQHNFVSEEGESSPSSSSYNAIVDSLGIQWIMDSFSNCWNSLIYQGLSQTDLNMRAAYLHILTDMMQSIGVAISGLFIWHYPSLQWIDPVTTLIFSITILWSTYSLMCKIVSILMIATPASVDQETIITALKNIPQVVDVDEIHLWDIGHSNSGGTSGLRNNSNVICTCHLIVMKSCTNHSLISIQASSILQSMGITQSTIQINVKRGTNAGVTAVAGLSRKESGTNGSSNSTGVDITELPV